MNVQEWVFAGTSLSALAGGAWTVVRFIDERRRDRQQRQEELEQRKLEQRWRRAQAAKGLLEELRDDIHAKAALTMLDSWSRNYQDHGGGQTGL